MRVLILGARGMLGHTLARVLREEFGYDVVGTARRSETGYLTFDARSGEEGLRKLLSDVGSVDLIVNCIATLKADLDSAPAGDVSSLLAINSRFPHQLAACASEGRIVHVSTDAVFSTDAGEVDEAVSPSPDFSDAYGQSKLEGEISADRAITLRCSIIGPDPIKKRGLVEWVRSQAGREIQGFTNQHWVGVTTHQFAQLCGRLAVEANFRAARSEGPIHHYCPNPPVSKFELVCRIAEKLDSGTRVRPVEAGKGVCRFLKSRYKILKALTQIPNSLEEVLKSETWS